MAPQSDEETILYNFEGLGVLSFGLPVIPGASPSGTIQVVPPSGNAYIALMLRNNAEGDYATNIIARIENVEPFQISECHNVYPESTGVSTATLQNLRRTTNCAPYSEDVDLLYTEHKLGEMYPDQEVEFFWTLVAPDVSEIADMFYDHTIYYAVEYDYKVTSAQIIYAMTQAEKTSRLSEGKSVTGSITTSHGEVKFIPNFNEPIMYSTGSGAQDHVLKYKVYNSNAKGTVKPGTKINITVTLPGEQGATTGDAYARVSDDTFLEGYGWQKMDTSNSGGVYTDEMTRWFAERFLSDLPTAAEKDEIVRRTIYTQVDAEFVRQTGSEYTFYVPVTLNGNIVPTVLSLPFYLRVSYRYLLDCKTATDCAQLRVEPLG